jgi:hypothetical protein
MKKPFGNSKYIRYTLCLAFALSGLQGAQAAQFGVYQHGTVVRMRTVDCIFSHHGFVATLGGPATPTDAGACPEYTLISDKVVFVIVGKSSNQIIPLADEIDFRFHHNELAVRVDDQRHENKFSIKEMILRSEWDRAQKRLEDQPNTPRASDPAMAARTQN